MRRRAESAVTESGRFPDFFVSADWSVDQGKRAVHVVDVGKRTIGWMNRPGWTLREILDLARNLMSGGSVLVGLDVAFGVPAAYWRAAQNVTGLPSGLNFVDWLGGIAPDSEFFEIVRSPDDWHEGRPFFRVQPGKGGLNAFTRLIENGFRRRIDSLTNANPMFAVSGIPGTVGGGTRAVWQELAPMLGRDRDFRIWPFEGGMPELLANFPIVIAEVYPALAYAIPLLDDLPTHRVIFPKTVPEARRRACSILEAKHWVRHASAATAGLEGAALNEDRFDSLIVAAAVLRCAIEGIGMWDNDHLDPMCEGSMLLAGPVDVARKAERFVLS